MTDDGGSRPAHQPHLSFRIDTSTKRYVSYCEHKPGTLAMAPRNFLNQPYPDVLRPLGALENFERAVQASRERNHPQTFIIDCWGIRQRVTVQCHGTYIHVDAEEVA